MEFVLEMLKSPSFNGLVILIIGAVALSVGVFAGKFYKKAIAEMDENLAKMELEKGTAFTESLIKWADVIVRAVQQSFKEAGGEEKLAIAIERLRKYVGEKMDITDEQLADYIEAAYGSAKEGFKKETV